MQSVPNVREFLDPALLPKGKVRIADKMERAESVSARKAALLDPTEEDETVKILRRRLFTGIDDARSTAVIEAYRRLWEAHKGQLPGEAPTTPAWRRLPPGFPSTPS